MNLNRRYTSKQMNFGYNNTQYTTDSYALHCHPFYEIYYFLGGDVDYLVEGHHYHPTPDSLLLLSPQCFHGVRINGITPYRRFSVHFDGDIVSQERRSLLLSSFSALEKSASQEIYFEQVDRFHIQDYLDALEEAAFFPLPDNEKEQLLSIRVEALLSQIFFLYQADTAYSTDTAADTVIRVIHYLNRHLTEDISLDMLSERFFISKHHLNKVFRKATGTTVFDYVLRKRVASAQLMLSQGTGAQEAALQCGFGDYSSFYRAYVRILGHSPIQDRRMPECQNA